MNSGLYTAFSGMRAQMTALDMLSNNLANVNTIGFKESRAFFTLLDQAMNDTASPRIGTVINNQVMAAEGSVNQVDGSLLATMRDLDIALTGNGYITVSTPRGLRYTRNGGLILGPQNVLSTVDGDAVLGMNGPIHLGPGKIHMTEAGEVFLDGKPVDRLRIVAFADPGLLQREGKSLFVPRTDQVQPVPGQARVRQGYLEQSNVNAVASVIGLVGILRNFEAIQKSVNLLMNDINAKVIDRLGH